MCLKLEIEPRSSSEVFPTFFLALVLGTVGYFSFSAVKIYVYEKNLGSDRESTELETIYLPRSKSGYPEPDFQIKLQIERRYLSQRGWRWDSPSLSQVNFAIDLDTLEPTELAPVDDDNVAIIKLSGVLSTAIAASYDDELSIYSSNIQLQYPDMVKIKYGLSYREAEPTGNGAINENYVTVQKPYNLKVLCKDNGNPYPDVCYMESIGEPGHGVFKQSPMAIMTDIWFRKERMPEWRFVKSQVEKFLADKIEVVPFREIRE